MPDIQHLIELLKSDDPNKRYDACEELRVSRHPLPQEAIEALQNTTNDSNPDVADAAQRAIALHTLPSKPVGVAEYKYDELEKIKDRNTMIVFFIVILAIVCVTAPWWLTLVFGICAGLC